MAHMQQSGSSRWRFRYCKPGRMASLCSSTHSRLAARSTRIADFVFAATFSYNYVTIQAFLSAAASFFQNTLHLGARENSHSALDPAPRTGYFAPLFGNIGQVVILVVVVPGEAVRACRT